MRLGNYFVSWVTAMVIVASAILTVVLVGYYGEGWKSLPAEGGGQRWQSGKTVHVDRNGDGVVDEISTELSKTNEFFIQRDTDLDGWFDIQYEIRSSIATHPRLIREKAPKH